MNNILSLYDILHPHIDFFDMVEKCEDIISEEYLSPTKYV